MATTEQGLENIIQLINQFKYGEGMPTRAEKLNREYKLIDSLANTFNKDKTYNIDSMRGTRDNLVNSLDNFSSDTRLVAESVIENMDNTINTSGVYNETRNTIMNKDINSYSFNIIPDLKEALAKSETGELEWEYSPLPMNDPNNPNKHLYDIMHEAVEFQKTLNSLEGVEDTQRFNTDLPFRNKVGKLRGDLDVLINSGLTGGGFSEFEIEMIGTGDFNAVTNAVSERNKEFELAQGEFMVLNREIDSHDVKTKTFLQSFENIMEQNEKSGIDYMQQHISTNEQFAKYFQSHTNLSSVGSSSEAMIAARLWNQFRDEESTHMKKLAQDHLSKMSEIAGRTIDEGHVTKWTPNYGKYINDKVTSQNNKKISIQSFKDEQEVFNAIAETKFQFADINWDSNPNIDKQKLLGILLDNPNLSSLDDKTKSQITIGNNSPIWNNLSNSEKQRLVDSWGSLPQNQRNQYNDDINQYLSFALTEIGKQNSPIQQIKTSNSSSSMNFIRNQSMKLNDGSKINLTTGVVDNISADYTKQNSSIESSKSEAKLIFEDKEVLKGKDNLQNKLVNTEPVLSKDNNVSYAQYKIDLKGYGDVLTSYSILPNTLGGFDIFTPIWLDNSDIRYAQDNFYEHYLDLVSSSSSTKVVHNSNNNIIKNPSFHKNMMIFKNVLQGKTGIDNSLKENKPLREQHVNEINYEAANKEGWDFSKDGRYVTKAPAWLGNMARQGSYKIYYDNNSNPFIRYGNRLKYIPLNQHEEGNVNIPVSHKDDNGVPYTDKMLVETQYGSIQRMLFYTSEWEKLLSNNGFYYDGPTSHGKASPILLQEYSKLSNVDGKRAIIDAKREGYNSIIEKTLEEFNSLYGEEINIDNFKDFIVNPYYRNISTRSTAKYIKSLSQYGQGLSLVIK